MKALVTGANGFVGAAVVRVLLAQGARVRALVRPASDTQNIDDIEVETAFGDLQSGDGVQAALQDCDALFHVAADYRLWVPDPEVMHAINVAGTGHLLQAAMTAGVKRIVYTSSVSAVGIPADGSPGDERTPVAIADMVGTYKRTKFLAEQLVMKMVRDESCPVITVNPSTPVGPRDVKPTPTGRVINDALHGRMPAFVDTGLNIVHVDDVAAGHLLAFEKGQIGERYILGGEDMSLRELLRQVAELAGRRPPTVRIPHRVAMALAHADETLARLTGRVPQVTVDAVRMSMKKMYFSSARACDELGYVARPASEAIADAVAWFSSLDR